MTYTETAEKIRQQIQSGVFGPGTKLSAREIAKQHSVSYLTANRALNLLNEQELVTRKPRGETYVNEPFPKYRLIGFSDAHYPQSVFNQTAGTFRELILNEFRKRQCKVRMLTRKDWIPEWLEDLDALLFAHGIDGEQQKLAASLGIPVLQFRGENIRNHPFHQAVIDLETGYGELFRHVTPDRFNRVLIVTGNKPPLSIRGELAERFALHSGFPKEKIEFISADNLVPERNYPVWKKIGADCRGSFIFTCGDYLAAGLISTLMAENIVVGRDVALAGYDDLEGNGFLPFGKPVITAIGYSRKDAAAAIAKQLQMLIQEPESMKCQTILRIPTHLIYRETMKG